MNSSEGKEYRVPKFTSSSKCFVTFWQTVVNCTVLPSPSCPWLTDFINMNYVKVMDACFLIHTSQQTQSKNDFVSALLDVSLTWTQGSFLNFLHCILLMLVYGQCCLASETWWISMVTIHLLHSILNSIAWGYTIFLVWTVE